MFISSDPHFNNTFLQFSHCPSLLSTLLPSSGEEEICSILSCNMRIYASFIYDVTPVLISGSRGL